VRAANSARDRLRYEEVHAGNKTKKEEGKLKTKYLRETSGVIKVSGTTAFCRIHCVLQEAMDALQNARATRFRTSPLLKSMRF
jgi:hypothetical protein